MLVLDLGPIFAEMSATLQHINQKIVSPSKSTSTIGGNDPVTRQPSKVLEFSANNPTAVAFMEGNNSATTISNGSVELDA